MAFNEADHPRNPKDSPNGMGGKFTVKTTTGDDTDLTAMPADDGTRFACSSQHARELFSLIDPVKSECQLTRATRWQPQGRIWDLGHRPYYPEQPPEGWYEYAVFNDDDEYEDDFLISTLDEEVASKAWDLYESEDDRGRATIVVSTNPDLDGAALSSQEADDPELDRYKSWAHHESMNRVLRECDDMSPTPERLRALRANAWTLIRHAETQSDRDRLRPLSFQHADSVVWFAHSTDRIRKPYKELDMFYRQLDERTQRDLASRKTVASDEYVRLDGQGGLEWVGEQERDRIFWEHRRDIFEAVRDDGRCTARGACDLAAAFGVERDWNDDGMSFTVKRD